MVAGETHGIRGPSGELSTCWQSQIYDAVSTRLFSCVVLIAAAENSTQAIVAVGETKSVLPKPKLGGLKHVVDTQTHAIGLVTPAPDIRAIVDKTAQFVAKNGKQCIWGSTADDCGVEQCLLCKLPLAHHVSLHVDTSSQLFSLSLHTAGTQFEGHILQREAQNSKFDFLRPGTPYNPYYKHMVTMAGWQLQPAQEHRP